MGRAPFASDVAAGRPFAGYESRFLEAILNRLGKFRSEYWFTYVQDRPCPNDNWSDDDAVDYRKATKDQLWEELRWLHAHKGARIIVPLGDEATAALGIPGNFGKIRGSVFELSLNWEGAVTDPSGEGFDMIAIPTYAPDWLQRKRFTSRKGQQDGDVGTADLLLTASNDIAKALTFVGFPYKRPVENFNLAPTVAEVLTWIEGAIEDNCLIGVDIETTDLNVYHGEIVVIGVARSGEDALSIPLLTSNEMHLGGQTVWSGVRRYWSPQDELIVQKAVRRLFAECPLVFQNGIFDIRWLRHHGYAFPWTSLAHDTLVLHHLVDPELPHNLGFITSVYGATPYWKEDFKSRKGTIMEMDQLEMRQYNCRDAVVLLQVLPGLIADLEDLGPETVALYYEERVPMVEVCVTLEENGVRLSRSRMTKWKTYIEEARNRLEEECRQIANLPASFKLTSAENLRYLFFSSVPAKTLRIKKQVEAGKLSRAGSKARAEQDAALEILQASPLWPEMKYKGRTSRKTGLLQVNAQGRMGLANAAVGRLTDIAKLANPEAKAEEKAHIETLHAFIKKFNEYAVAVKLASTYTAFPVGPDRRVHGRYIPYGTKTTRLASRDPNMQNISKKGLGKEVRRVFVAEVDHVLLSFDYANLEFGTMAYETGEPNFIEIFEKDLNIHDINTRGVLGLTPEDPAWEVGRKAMKIFQFGHIQYGGGAQEILEKVNIEVPQLGLTLSKFKEASARYMENNPTFAGWRMAQAEKARNRRVENAFGLVRKLYGPESQLLKLCYNFPCQSAAAHIINRATIKIIRLDLAALGAKLVMQIHDQLIFEVPRKNAGTLVEWVLPLMREPINFRGRMVHFNTDPEVGEDLADLRDVEHEEGQSWQEAVEAALKRETKFHTVVEEGTLSEEDEDDPDFDEELMLEDEVFGRG